MSGKKQMNLELSKGCSMYEPCPICFKCQNKATHLYARCITCPLDFCGHNHKQRAFMINRDNFAIKVSKETYETIKRAADKAFGRSQENENEKTKENA